MLSNFLTKPHVDELEKFNMDITKQKSKAITAKFCYCVETMNEAMSVSKAPKIANTPTKYKCEVQCSNINRSQRSVPIHGSCPQTTSIVIGVQCYDIHQLKTCD